MTKRWVEKSEDGIMVLPRTRTSRVPLLAGQKDEFKCQLIYDRSQRKK